MKVSGSRTMSMPLPSTSGDFAVSPIAAVSLFELATDRVIATERFSVEWAAAASGASNLVSRDEGHSKLGGLNATRRQGR